MAHGRKARSEPLLVAVSSRFVTKTKRWERISLKVFCSLRPALWVGRQAHQAVQPSIEIGLVGFERAVGEVFASASDGAGPLQQALQARPEHRVSLVDGVLHVADEVGEAELLFLRRPAGLAAERSEIQ